MSGIKQSIGSAKARQGRKVKVAPMTQAVRRALAASAMAFALSVGSGAMAANQAAASPRHAAMVHQAGFEAFAAERGQGGLALEDDHVHNRGKASRLL